MTKNSGEKNLLLKNARDKISKLRVDAFLATDDKDIFYLTGFAMPGARLLISKKEKPLYFIDNMNTPLASERLKGIDLGGIISGAALSNIAIHLRSAKIKKIGTNTKKITLTENNILLKKVSGLKIINHDPIQRMRLIKTDTEIAILRKAAKKTIGLWRRVKKSLKPGMTEIEVSRMIDILIREEAEANSFQTIAATGKNTAYPHAVSTKRKLRENELFLADFGMVCEGYCSDLTRTWYKGRINHQIREFVTQVQKAHDYAIKIAKPGIKIGKFVKAVNSMIINNNMGEYICHGLGHGVGLDIHEGPYLTAKSKERLKKDMVITIEPGLYKPGLGGVREEDMILITKNGCEVLTR